MTLEIYQDITWDVQWCVLYFDAVSSEYVQVDPDSRIADFVKSRILNLTVLGNTKMYFHDLEHRL